MLMYTLCIIALILIHTIADFVFQTDDEAKGKSENNFMLLRHTTKYAGISLIAWTFTFLNILSLKQLLILTAVTFVFHTVQDYITSRITKYYYLQEKRHEFFVTIGFDQFFHFVQLILTFYFIVR